MTELSETLPELEPTEQAADAAAAITPPSAADASLLALVDRLAGLLERSDLVELEVGAGSTGLVLRKPAALASVAAFAQPEMMALEAPVAQVPPDTAPQPTPAAAPASRSRTVLAPLTGIFYTSPSPGSPTYVTPGAEVVAGQVIGLIEAMKLFNEIKSDQSGRVVRYVAEHGGLVKAKQPLLEVEPL